MKLKTYKEKYSKKVLKKKPKEKKLIDWNWVITITSLSFIISFIFSGVSEALIPNINLIFAVLLVLLVVIIGVIFDVIGIATTAADIKTFNSMATKKVRGSELAVNFIKQADRVSSFCNDVIGDICGIISGSGGAAISLIIAHKYNLSVFGVTLIMTAVLASITIGGKAMGKSYAVNKSNLILYNFASFLSIFYKSKK